MRNGTDTGLNNVKVSDGRYRGRCTTILTRLDENVPYDTGMCHSSCSRVMADRRPFLAASRWTLANCRCSPPSWTRVGSSLSLTISTRNPVMNLSNSRSNISKAARATMPPSTATSLSLSSFRLSSRIAAISTMCLELTLTLASMAFAKLTILSCSAASSLTLDLVSCSPQMEATTPPATADMRAVTMNLAVLPAIAAVPVMRSTMAPHLVRSVWHRYPSLLWTTTGRLALV